MNRYVHHNKAIGTPRKIKVVKLANRKGKDKDKDLLIQNYQPLRGQQTKHIPSLIVLFKS